MKKFLLVLACLVLLVSCAQEKKENLCYYGFFGDRAVMIAYNGKANKLYDIKLPLETIINWGIANGIENIPNALRSFANFKDNGFMMGNADTFDSIILINRAVKDDYDVIRSIAFQNNMNKLCSVSFSELASVIDEDTVFVKIDSSDFNGTQSFFAEWVRQIYGE